MIKILHIITTLDKGGAEHSLFNLVSNLKETLKLIQNESPISNDECYFYRLSLAHEYMHIEAFAMTAQYLGFPLLCVHKKYLDKGFKSYRKTTICKFSKLQKDTKY